MHLIELDRGVSEICQAWEDAGADARRSPFFLIVGAGVSCPSVLTAGQIVEHCKSVAAGYGRNTGPAPANALDEYSSWFSLAYPQARLRQKYFRQLIQDKPISLANLLLAHLLSARKLTNLVVTTNFDDLLSKALVLFGQKPVVCDHPATVARIDLERDDIQIVHVHGSYLFYDCANLRVEVAGRAHMDPENSLTMLGLLDTVLLTRSPIVAGYSGWEGDVIMNALHRRLSRGQVLGQSIYWCCYRREEAQRLPEWLRESADVRIIVPPEKGQAEQYPAQGGLVRSGESAKPVGEGGPVLEAREVFQRLTEAMRADTPPLLVDPFRFLADQLEAALPQICDDETSRGDPYGFQNLVRRLRAASGQAPAPAKPKFSDKVNAVTAAIRESRYSEAIRAAAELIPFRLASLSPEQRKHVLSAAALAGDALLAKGKPDPDLAGALARALSVDARRDDSVGALPEGTAIVFPSRPGTFSFESVVGDQPRGAFSVHFEEALAGAIRAQRAKPPSLDELVVDASTRMLRQGILQCPAVAGAGAEVSLFPDRARRGRKRAGRLVALLVGIDRYKMGTNLNGCVNDITAFAALCRKNEAVFGKPRIRRLTNAEATAAGVRAELGRTGTAAAEQDVLLFYYSGHSTADTANRPVLVLHDYDGTRGMLAVAEIAAEILKPFPAKQKIVILD